MKRLRLTGAEICVGFRPLQPFMKHFPPYVEEENTQLPPNWVTHVATRIEGILQVGGWVMGMSINWLRAAYSAHCGGPSSESLPEDFEGAAPRANEPRSALAPLSFLMLGIPFLGDFVGENVMKSNASRSRQRFSRLHGDFRLNMVV